MREIRRSTEPEFFGDLRLKYRKWDDLDGGDRRHIRHALAEGDFGRTCAYCEQPCCPPSRPTEDEKRECDPLGPGRRTDEETIDHFRPRSRFPHLWLNWDNLVYACYRCNQSKCDQWPELDDKVNSDFSVGYLSYTSVSEYVNPNSSAGKRPAQDFFDFHFDAITAEVSPEMIPARGVDHGGMLSAEEQSMALRTILDIDLNDDKSGLGYNDSRHLWERRRRHRDLLVRRLNSVDDFETKFKIAIEFMLPNKPFSGFISAYLINRFPNLGLLLGRPQIPPI